LLKPPTPHPPSVLLERQSSRHSRPKPDFDQPSHAALRFPRSGHCQMFAAFKKFDDRIAGLSDF
jgi:hypothetical protein